MVITVDPALVADLKKGADDYRKRDLFAFRAYDTTHLELARGGQTIAFDKDQRRQPGRRRQMAARRRVGGRRQREDERPAREAREPPRDVVRRPGGGRAGHANLDRDGQVRRGQEGGARVRSGRPKATSMRAGPANRRGAKINPTEYDEIIRSLMNSRSTHVVFACSVVLSAQSPSTSLRSLDQLHHDIDAVSAPRSSKNALGVS